MAPEEDESITRQKLKAQGCHFIAPLQLRYFADLLEKSGMDASNATVAANMYGRWFHQKDQPVRIRDEVRLHRIGKETARKIWALLAEAFELEMTQYQVKGRDKGYQVRERVHTDPIPSARGSQGPPTVSTQTHDGSTQTPPRVHADPHQETKQETDQEPFSRGTKKDQLGELRPLLEEYMAAKKGAKSKQARQIIEEEVCKIWEKHGIKAAEEQLRQAIAAGWPTISLELYDQHRHKKTEESSSHPAQKLHGAAASQQEAPVPEGLEPGVTPQIWANMRLLGTSAPNQWPEYPIAAQKAEELAIRRQQSVLETPDELVSDAGADILNQLVAN